MRKLLAIFFILIVPTCFGQQPSHFKIGEDELAGVHIYDLLQDQNLDYWIATNSGLYNYNYYDFNKVESDEMSSSSLFNLIENDKGEIFCNNLSGQIFRFANDSLNLFYQIPDTLMHHEIGIEFDDQWNLVVLTNCLFSLNEEKEVLFLFNDRTRSYSGGLLRDNQGGLNYSCIATNTLFTYINGQNIQQSFSGNVRPSILATESKILLCDQIEGQLIDFNNTLDSNEQIKPIKGTLYYIEHENLWQASRTGGANLYDQNLKPLFKGSKVFPQHFISALLTDKEGNILLGTFGDGILVIPALKTLDYQVPGLNDRAVEIEVTPEGALYVGCRSGKVYLLSQDGESSLISEESKKTIEYLEFLESENEIIFDGHAGKPTLSYHVKSKEFSYYDLLSLKDIKEVGGRKFLVGTNSGCFWLHPETSDFERIEAFKGRTNCVEFERDAELIYSGSAAGLQIGDELGIVFFEINNTPIICRKMLYKDGLVMICTQKNGILIFDDGQLIDSWNLQSGLSSNNTFDLIAYKDEFILTTESGIYLTNNKGESTYKFSTSIGLKPVKPLDIEIHNDVLYIVYRDAIKTLDLSKFQINIFKPKVDLTEVKVNDLAHQKNHNNFEYDENKITFSLTSKSLKHKSEITYHYQLSGIDNEWQQRGFSENVIEYKSLNSGDYEFQYYCQYEAEKSDLKTYQFNIATPFWKTYWFIGLVILLFVMTVLFIYRFQFRRQKKLNEIKRESIESKLIAIQSQMNPHFIFNSLNSIQDLVLQQDEENAYNYISKFAFLVRKVLHYSALDFIRLEDEVEVLKVYLELEQLRFDDDFEFSFNVHVEEDFEIPPMILQPFVENAIKHGLLHKDGLKKLDIVFQIEGDVLLAEITDNGIGRKKSREIQERKATNHQSFSTQSIQHRLDILKNIHGEEFGTKYIDLEDEEGNATGTKVILRIPIRKNY